MPAEEKKKVPIGAMMSGPGPAKYALPQHTGTANLDVRKTFAPAYSMRPLHKDLSSSERSPGPKYMIKPGLFRDGSYYGKQYTMRPLYKEIKSMATPGPGKYGAADPTKTIERNAPSYTMRPQLRFGKTDKIPGANSYKLPTMTGTRVNMSAPGRLASEPSWSLTGRSDYGSFTGVGNKNPGPGKYAPENTMRANKQASPAYTMRPRTYAPLAGTSTPGPKYNHNGIRKAVTGGTFGSKHSQYAYVVME